VIVHARSGQQARELRTAIAARLADCGLALNERKTRIVYCKDSTRRGCCEDERFDFLGYTFRPRLSRNKSGGQFVNFLPAASDDARKRMRREVRRWRLHLRPDKTLTDLARIFNPIIQGWINYYGRFYRSVLKKALRPINAYLVRWAQCKCKRLRRTAKARRFLVDVFERQPDLFPHWRIRCAPRRLDDGSPVSGDVHAGF
jgi:RNA-directed DNA polymerase